jgi:hypothetical protein
MKTDAISLRARASGCARRRLARGPATRPTHDLTQQHPAGAEDSLLEPVNQPAAVGIIADDLLPRITARHHVINRFLEFDPQSSWHAGRQDIGRAVVTLKELFVRSNRPAYPLSEARGGLRPGVSRRPSRRRAGRIPGGRGRPGPYRAASPGGQGGELASAMWNSPRTSGSRRATSASGNGCTSCTTAARLIPGYCGSRTVLVSWSWKPRGASGSMRQPYSMRRTGLDHDYWGNIEATRAKEGGR